MVVKLFIEEGGEFTEIDLSDSKFKRYTVLQLKTKIREKLTTRESSQELIYKGYLLRDDDILSHFGIQHKSTIHLETQPVTKTLFIKDNHGQTNTFFLDEEFKSYTVLQLKTKIREKLTTRESSQELIFKWCVLKDAAKLSDYGIQHESTIHFGTQPVTIQFIIKDYLGRRHTFCLDEDEFKSCRVEHLKRRLQDILGTPVKIMGAAQTNTTEMVVKLFIKEGGEITEIDLSDSEFESYTVLQLKTKIREKLTTRESSQELIFKGRLLRDDDQLSVYGIRHKSTIHLETQDQQRLIFGGKQLEESVTMFWGGPVEGVCRMGDKGGKNRSMETVLNL